MNSLVIKNAILCDHSGSRKMDLKIEDGIISEISSEIRGDCALDASSLMLLPSCIDLNIRPKSNTKKDFQILENKAIKGGVGTIVFPALPEHLELFNVFNAQSQIPFLASLVPYVQQQIQEVSTLCCEGAVSLQLNTQIPSQALDCIYQYSKMLHLPCTCSFVADGRGVAFESELSYKMGLSSFSSHFENMEFSRLLSLVTHYQVPTLFQSISDLDFWNQIQNNALSEVSIHHLILNEEKILGYNTWAKLAPPLMKQEIQTQFLQGIQKIDMLTSLHREFSTHSKEQTFEDATCGVDCLGFYFPLLYTKLVLAGHLSLEDLSQKTSFAQAQFLKLNQGEIAVGREAHLMLVDPQGEIRISHPLYGECKLFGKVKSVISPKSGVLES